MQMTDKATVWKRKNIAPVLLVCFAITTSAGAKDKPAESEQRVNVIAHLSLPGPPVSQMFVQQEGTKQYLYVRQPSEQGFTIVDVSRPSKPNVVKRDAWPNTASSGKLEMVGSGIALAETPESSGAGVARHELVPAKVQPAAADARPAQSVRVLDLSDPKNPRTLQTFDGVTSILADDGRSLIYIANGEGLWILKHSPRKRQMPLCDSESVFSPIADCQ